jgi:hypothetical protein
MPGVAGSSAHFTTLDLVVLAAYFLAIVFGSAAVLGVGLVAGRNSPSRSKEDPAS